MPNRTTGSKPTVDATVVTKADIDARNRVNALDDTQPGNGSEIALADGRNRRDHAYGDFIEIVRHAEQLVYDGTTAIKIEAELDNARRQGQARQHTDRATVQAIVTYATEWLARIDGDES